MSVDYKARIDLCHYVATREVWGIILEHPPNIIQTHNYLNRISFGGINRFDCWPLRALEKTEVYTQEVTIRARCLFVKDEKKSSNSSQKQGWLQNTANSFGLITETTPEQPQYQPSIKLVRMGHIFVPSSIEHRTSSLKKIFSENNQPLKFLVFFISDSMTLEEVVETRNYLYQLLRSHKLRHLTLHLVIGNRNSYIGDTTFNTVESIEKHFNLRSLLFSKVQFYFTSSGDWAKNLDGALYKSI